MEVRCDKCQARYKVDDARIGPQGLTMRCGKCQNTFKVMKPAPAAAEAAPEPPPKPAPPAPKAPPPKEGATMMFAAPKLEKPAAAPPSKPAAPAAKPVAKPAAAAAAAAPAVEGAGSTMMFQTGNLKTPAASPKKEPESGATMVFGQSPIAAPAKPAAAPKPAAKPGPEATMVFGQSPIAAAKPAAKPAPAPPAAAPEPEPEPEAEPPPDTAETPADGNPPAEMAAADEHEEATAPGMEGEAPADAEADDGNIHAEGAEAQEEEPAAQDGAFDKAPPKGLLIGVGAGIAVLLLAGVAIFAVKKLGKHPPPPAAVESLATASAAADKDTLASIAEAEGKAREAIDAAGPKSYFPQSTATLALIEIQWADALNDQAALWTAKADSLADAKKTEAETKAAEMAAQAKTKLKAAFDTVDPALKLDAKSPDLELAKADYFRAMRSNSNMNKELKKATALKAEPARISLVQGMAAAQEDDGAEKALPKLKEALAASPQSARIHFRLAMAYLQMKDEANATKELKETLKLSPQHERAKMALESLAPPPPAEPK